MLIHLRRCYHNVVIVRMTNDNKNRRTFSYDSPYGRSPDDIKNGVYPDEDLVIILNQLSL